MIKQSLKFVFLLLLVSACLINNILTQTKKAKTQNNPEKERLIEMFKEKLLEILNIKDLGFQNSSIINDMNQQHNIPYPVLKEYESVIQENENRKNSLKKNLTGYQNDMPSAEFELQIERNKEKDEQIRFSSFIEEITLLPKSYSCSENSTITQQKNYQFEVLSCFEIRIENPEFYEFEIESAKMYFQLNSSQIKTLNYLFIEVNNEFIKKFNLKDYVKKEKSNVITNEDRDDDSVYDYVDMREFINNILFKSEIDSQRDGKLNIKFLNMKSKKTNDASNNKQDLFTNVHEQFALIVKFGERAIHEYKYADACKKTPNLKYCQYKKDYYKQMPKTRLKRSNEYGKILNTQNRQEKRFYDCDEVRNDRLPPNKCCRETITISIKDIGWSNWIARPDTIDFKYCRGGCTG
jgi:hypothetical protein